MMADNLQAAIEQASSETHEREFEVGGQVLTFPRLSIGDQGKFERFVRTTPGGNPIFSLGGTRNKTAMVMGNIIRETKLALAQTRAKNGEPAIPVTLEDVKKVAEDLQAGIMERFEPFSDRIFGGFTRDQMLYAVAMSLVASHGSDEITYNTTIDEELVPITVSIDAEFADSLFCNGPGKTMDDVFMYVTGLAEKPTLATDKLKPGMTPDDIADKTIGNAENSSGEQDSE